PYRTVPGRTGLVRTLLLEVTSLTPETQQAFSETGVHAFGAFAQYLSAQMAAGRLRRLHPMLAVQSLVGGVMFHLLAAPVLGQATIAVPAGEPAALQFAQVWLRGMRPEARGVATLAYAVAVDAVSKRFGPIVALDKATLQIRRGEVYGL